MDQNLGEEIARPRRAPTRPPWTVAYVCRPLDDRNPNSATQILWVRALADEPRVRHVHVLTSRLGDVDLPSNVTVHLRSRGKGGRLLGTALPFYRALRALPEPIDFYFVVGGGPYPALLLPLKLIKGKPIYHWKALPVVTRRMRFYARYCDDLFFTATPSSLPLPLPNRRVVGHGIDVERFRPGTRQPDRDLLVLGRVSPIKKIDQAIELVAMAAQAGELWRLDIVGPVSKSGRGYRTELQELANRLDVAPLVNFVEPAEHAKVPDLLGRYKVMLSFSGTAFDKAVGEAMACGLPVLTTNRSVLERIPPDLEPHTALPDDPAARLERLGNVLTLDASQRQDLGWRLRRFIEEQHSLSAFFGKVLDEIEAESARYAYSREI